jgi:hypothetical protein
VCSNQPTSGKELPEARYALRLRRIQTLRCWQTGTVRIAALALALVVGTAGPSLADDLEPASDAAVHEKVPPDEAPGSHVHDRQPPPSDPRGRS